MIVPQCGTRALASPAEDFKISLSGLGALKVGALNMDLDIGADPDIYMLR